LIFVAFAALAQKPAPEYEIRAAREKSNQAFKTRDVKAAGESLTDDYTVTRGNGAAVATKATYLEALAATFGNWSAVWYQRTTDKVDISTASPVIAAEHGHWQGRYPDGRKAYGGTYLAMWRRTSAGWKIRSELFVVLTCDDPPACREYTK
jgi:ketosteroid isomerase-like protein